ncbi:MAG: CBS domain-containing protein [Nitrosopumilaceae archaeon]|nr:CBS domain-containing protein [Nitrosopumilaceae archaeon]NIU00908.1 CBS domain-containing protein [Nitrosopumilaceae archaeon]NIU87361.1 CBS domain-containing protein [Nitrosopumilaceae archaeon]NIV65889.1 CBS domain-containing protein [Nitrosopumilaceae archaeon]NIX61510.1 CBS domain-containing protein [Nitrosopumilaceae archaeon]
MNREVVSVNASVTINEVAKVMEDTKVGAIVVMENNTPIGIVTDRDFAIKVASHAYPITDSIKKIMSSPLITIGTNESVWSIADLMHIRGIRKLPVVENDKVVGIVTATDLVKQFATATEEDMLKMYHQSVIKVYKTYSPYK